jgi:hypothetical protein
MKKSDAFPSRFFKADDVKERPIVVTIDRMYQDQIGAEKQDKNILAFSDANKELVVSAPTGTALSTAPAALIPTTGAGTRSCCSTPGSTTARRRWTRSG